MDWIITGDISVNIWWNDNWWCMSVKCGTWWCLNVKHWWYDNWWCVSVKHCFCCQRPLFNCDGYGVNNSIPSVLKLLQKYMCRFLPEKLRVPQPITNSSHFMETVGMPHCRVQNSPPFIPILSQLNPFYTIYFYLLNIRFTIVLQSASRS
jgi:hypothetical protein